MEIINEIIKLRKLHPNSTIILAYGNMHTGNSLFIEGIRMKSWTNFDIFKYLDKIRELNICMHWFVNYYSLDFGWDQVFKDVELLKKYVKFGDLICIYFYKINFAQIEEILNCFNFYYRLSITISTSESDINNIHKNYTECFEYTKFDIRFHLGYV